MTAVAVRPEQPVLVVAGDYHQFCLWCREHGYHHTDPKVRYVMRTQDLRGRRGARYVLTGTWYDRPEWPEIEWTLQANAMVRFEFAPPKPLRWEWVELDAETEDFKRKVEEARRSLAEFAELAKPPEVELGPEWEALKKRWKAA